MTNWLQGVVLAGFSRPLGSRDPLPPPPEEPFLFRGTFRTGEDHGGIDWARPRIIDHGNTSEERARERRR